ncbi:hypothetical protein FCR2A7T_25960 [Flavobacterium cauense R2A-7]|uniref:Uncharacterized protein n=1 Tax=Flavobacterium cauense R2A-7 TaxID=1341154 RepID=V6RXK0_9FLAO|nr:hypothetical protein [Flavobacterium cauense]ESU19173.1 hypothetical protein FCR2A7T_25960 [Flavobacterium cauense R2A-7]KGO82200.1 hypothetical protein Q762_05800 [Flavobacterium cauense R2A-7]TWI15155.1 hypothetical protein IP98_00144 [Flavobacterium cauense R2A-7]
MNTCSSKAITTDYLHEGLYEETVNLQNASVDVFSVIKNDTIRILISVNHNQINTLLNLTGVQPYELLYFDENKNFTGKAFSLFTGAAPFHIQTTAHYILLNPLFK